MPVRREPLPVVCALLLDESGRVLVAQRPAHKHHGGRWEFPGGKIEPGERPEAALIRELREELGCAVTPVQVLPSRRSDPARDGVFIELIPMVARLAAGSPPPVLLEHTALRWVPVAELAGLDLAPADRLVAGHFASITSDGLRPEVPRPSGRSAARSKSAQIKKAR